MTDFEIVKIPGLSKMVYSRESGGIVVLTYPSTLPAGQMATILQSLGLSSECKAVKANEREFRYGSIYATLDDRQVTNVATNWAWFHRTDDSPEAISLRKDIERHLTPQTSPR